MANDLASWRLNDIAISYDVYYTNHLRMQTMETPIWTIESTSKRRSAGVWKGGFAKVWLPNLRAGPDCKIIPSPMPFGCWSDGLDWSFHSLHTKVVCIAYVALLTFYLCTLSSLNKWIYQFIFHSWASSWANIYIISWCTKRSSHMMVSRLGQTTTLWQKQLQCTY